MLEPVHRRRLAQVRGVRGELLQPGLRAGDGPQARSQAQAARRLSLRCDGRRPRCRRGGVGRGRARRAAPARRPAPQFLRRLAPQADALAVRPQLEGSPLVPDRPAVHVPRRRSRWGRRCGDGMRAMCTPVALRRAIALRERVLELMSARGAAPTCSPADRA
eukprot:5874389-Prymnesium_polylepis.1